MIAVYCSFQTLLEKPEIYLGPLILLLLCCCFLFYLLLEFHACFHSDSCKLHTDIILQIKFGAWGLFGRLWFILIFVTRKSVFYLTFYSRFEIIFFTLPSVLRKWIFPVSLNQGSLSRFSLMNLYFRCS